MGISFRLSRTPTKHQENLNLEHIMFKLFLLVTILNLVLAKQSVPVEGDGHASPGDYEIEMEAKVPERRQASERLLGWPFRCLNEDEVCLTLGSCCNPDQECQVCPQGKKKCLFGHLPCSPSPATTQAPTTAPAPAPTSAPN